MTAIADIDNYTYQYAALLLLQRGMERTVESKSDSYDAKNQCDDSAH